MIYHSMNHREIVQVFSVRISGIVWVDNIRNDWLTVAFRCHRPIRTNACPLKRSKKSLRRKRFVSVVNLMVNGISPRGKRKIGGRMGTHKRKWRGVIPFVLGIFRSAPALALSFYAHLLSRMYQNLK